jgi:hypothetical protein
MSNGNKEKTPFIKDSNDNVKKTINLNKQLYYELNLSFIKII